MSRPAAVSDPAWAELFGPSRVAVQPMAPVDIEAFVEQWHEALAATLQGGGGAAAPRRLTREILASGGLRQLAETPLLCAAVCYLHRVKQGLLPRRLNALYRELCDLLIHRLDETAFETEGQETAEPRAARAGPGGQAQPPGPPRALHGPRAGGSARPGARGSADRGRAPGLRKLDPAQAPDVLDALQERSGVLRGASPTLVEFAHNGLRSYLAATSLPGRERHHGPDRQGAGYGRSRPAGPRRRAGCQELPGRVGPPLISAFAGRSVGTKSRARAEDHGCAVWCHGRGLGRA